MPFFLITVGVFLIVLNVNAIRKEKNSFQAIVKNQENEITDFDVAVGELRREFSETILELQKEIYSQRDLIEALKNELNTSKFDNASEKVFVESEAHIEDEKKIKETILNDRELIDEENLEIKMETEESFIDNSKTSDSLAETEEAETLVNESLDTQNNNVRVKEIGDLINKGVPLDVICEKYNIGKGEVLLIKELYLK